MSNLHNMSWMQFDCSEEMLLKIAELDAMHSRAVSIWIKAVITVKNNGGIYSLATLVQGFISQHLSKKLVVDILAATEFFVLDLQRSTIRFSEHGLSCFKRSHAKKDSKPNSPCSIEQGGTTPPVTPQQGGTTPPDTASNAPTRREERIENKENKNISVSDVSETPTTPTETERETKAAIDKGKKAASESRVSPEEADFNRQMKEHYPRVSSMKKPLTWDQYRKLKEKYSVEEIAHTLKCMENRANLNTRYVSAYLTVLNWIHYERNRSSG